MTSYFHNGAPILKKIVLTLLAPCTEPGFENIKNLIGYCWKRIYLAFRISKQNFNSYFTSKATAISKYVIILPFFHKLLIKNWWRQQIMCQNKPCIDMYNPAKFHDISSIFQDFMRGGMFCPPPRIIIPQNSPG